MASTSVQPTPSTLLVVAQIMPPCPGSPDNIVISVMTWQHPTDYLGHCYTAVPFLAVALGSSHCLVNFFLFFSLLFSFFFLSLFRAASTAYGSSQAKGLIRAIAARLHHSHSNAGSKLCL